MSVDKSQTERLRRLRGKIQAARRIASPTVPEEGPHRSTSESTRLSRSFGQMTYIAINAAGATEASSCCPTIQ